jgi:4'-phosphopantetheinyl transferase
MILAHVVQAKNISNVMGRLLKADFDMTKWQEHINPKDLKDSITYFKNNNNILHIWKLKFLDNLTDAQFQKGLSVLSEAERTKALRYKFRYLQEKYIQAQYHLRYLLGLYLDITPDEVEFILGEHGKPYLKNNSGGSDFKLQFNISHSKDYSVLAFTKDREIGVDIEKIDEKSYLELADRFFSKKEKKLLHAHDSDIEAVKLGFYRLWTRKEAYLKAIGLGLHYPLDAFSVNIADEPKFLDDNVAAKWSLGSFSIDSGELSDGEAEKAINYCGCWVIEKDTKSPTPIKNIRKSLFKIKNML